RKIGTAPAKTNSIPEDLLSASSGKHLRITAQNTRLPVLAEATVTEINEKSPMIKSFTFQIRNPQFDFKAGQWVDMFIPGMETVGGFSMYSSPTYLAETQTIKLGVKFSKWPPSHWLSTECQVGSTVSLRVGGDFFYAPEIDEAPHDLLLVAGGVGVNPLASMFYHAAHLYDLYLMDPKVHSPGKVLMLFSARNKQELLYKDELDEISSRHSRMKVKYFTTRETPNENSDVIGGHITEDVLRNTLSSMDLSSLKTFVCGPPPMIEAIESSLLKCNLEHHQILYEKWW
ncbi:unnamed protein product, partial [Meganyctiphanes norvegica]